MTKKVTIEATNITTKQWNTLLIELNLITKAWKPFATLTLKANGLNKVLTWGTRKGKELEENIDGSKSIKALILE